MLQASKLVTTNSSSLRTTPTLRGAAKRAQLPNSAAKSAVVVRSHGSKKALAELVSVAPVTQYPIWRGGGVVFGPRGNENYKLGLSTTSKRVALRQALTLATKAKKIEVLAVTSSGKTKEVADFLTKNKLERRVLIVVDVKTPELIRATRNIERVELISAKYLSVYHILNADKIVIAPKAVAIINDWLGAGSPRNPVSRGERKETK